MTNNAASGTLNVKIIENLNSRTNINRTVPFALGGGHKFRSGLLKKYCVASAITDRKYNINVIAIIIPENQSTSPRNVVIKISLNDIIEFLKNIQKYTKIIENIKDA